MAPVTLMPHEDIRGRFVIFAQMFAKEGQGDKLESLLAKVAAYSNDKTKEPLTMTYRVHRGAGPDRHKFVVYEEYENRDGITHHRTSEPYLTLRNSGTFEETIVNFFEEFSVDKPTQSGSGSAQ